MSEVVRPAEPSRSLQPGAGEPLRVLVIDDDELDRLAVRRSLQRSGLAATADEAGSAAETLARLRAARYDCILLDYYLPGVDTLGLLGDIRDAARHTPIVIFTGRGDEDVAVELMKAGAADYLPKASLTPERLASGVRHALGVTRAAHARQRAETFLRLMSEAAEHLLAAADPVELVRGLFSQIKDAVGADAYFSYVAEEGREELKLSSSAGIPQEALPAVCHSGAGAFVAQSAAAGREPVHVTGIQQADDTMRSLKDAGLRAVACYPLIAEYRLLGALCFASAGKDAFAADELGFLKTVSHYVAAAIERLRHIEQLRENDRRKDEFLATLSHELRDPLGPLRNMLDVLKRADDADTLTAATAVMERQLGQLEHLVDDLLDVSRITESRLRLRRRRVELAPIVRQAVEAVAGLVERARQDLSVDLPSEPVYVDGDPVRLAQVFGNLLTNASKYTDEGGSIRLTAERAGGEAVLSVRDSGIGIPPDKLRTVFDMFSQVESSASRSGGGLGIGLTLVKRLVEMHGGSVEARSEGLGCGSEFIVRLPVIAEEEKARASARPEEPAAAVQSRRILVVDDNRDSVMSLAMLLQAMGHATHEAFDGKAAIAAAERHRPQVVLLDIGLPELDGYEVCRRIRAEPWGREIVVVALTGWGQDEDRRKSDEAGFDCHLVKPVSYAMLVELLAAPRPSRPTS